MGRCRQFTIRIPETTLLKDPVTGLVLEQEECGEAGIMDLMYPLAEYLETRFAGRTVKITISVEL